MRQRHPPLQFPRTAENAAYYSLLTPVSSMRIIIGSMKTSIQQGVEFFHLAFIAFLGTKLEKKQYVLKGGCNLRFFFGSPRYSEDMDLDLGDIPLHVTRDKVNAILGSKSFEQALAVGDVVIEHVTEHKQTETTQRWKLGLFISGSERPVPTKVEFSRRGTHADIVFDTLSPNLLHRYRMAPFVTAHYPGEVALLQKIEALATRRVTQARDVFDCYILLSTERMRLIRPLLDISRIEAARSNALALSFDDFKGQVLAYLQAEDQAAYDSPEVWESMQINLLHMLEPGP